MCCRRKIVCSQINACQSVLSVGTAGTTEHTNYYGGPCERGPTVHTKPYIFRYFYSQYLVLFTTVVPRNSFSQRPLLTFVPDTTEKSLLQNVHPSYQVPGRASCLFATRQRLLKISVLYHYTLPDTGIY